MKREATKQYRKIMVITISIIVLGAVLGVVLLYGGGNKILQDGFLGTTEIPGEFTAEEKTEIRRVLNALWLEDDDCGGFGREKLLTPMYLYKAETVLSLGELLPEYDFSELKQRLDFLTEIDPMKFGFLDLIYYVHICRRLELDIDYSKTEACLLKFYDSDNQLFFIDEIRESVENKMTASAYVKNAFGEKLNLERFEIRQGLERAYNEYEFSIDEEKGLANSGGDVLYCIAVYGFHDIPDWEKLGSWISFWKEKTDKAIAAGGLYAASTAFYFSTLAGEVLPGYGLETIHNCYESIDTAVINQTEDLSFVVSALKGNTKWDNPTVNTVLSDRIMQIVSNGKLVELGTEVNFLSTAYGVMLAKKADYPLNYTKLRNLVETGYRDIEEKKSVPAFNRADQLHSLLFLDCVLNGASVKTDKEYWTRQLDEIIGQLIQEKDENLTYSVWGLTMTSEVVSELLSCGCEIEISRKQRSKIRKIIKQAISDENIRESELMAEITYIDYLFSFGVVSENTIVKAYEKLQSDGGAKYTVDLAHADMYTTYRFFSLFAKLHLNTWIDEQKHFSETLRTESGLYSSGADLGSGGINLQSTALGYILRGSEGR